VQDIAETSLLITALWCIGEFGEMLLPGVGGPLLEGEPACNAADKVGTCHWPAVEGSL
jgi:hypothetical protein